MRQSNRPDSFANQGKSADMVEEEKIRWGCMVPIVMGVITGILAGGLTFHDASPYPAGIQLEALRNAAVAGGLMTGLTAFLGNKFASRS